MNLLPPGEVDADAAVAQIDSRSVIAALPPLIKGYLRLGCYIGEGAVVDHEFGTTDVLVVLPVSAIRKRYMEHFGQSRSAA
jgi:putative hemolysin